MRFHVLDRFRSVLILPVLIVLATVSPSAAQAQQGTPTVSVAGGYTSETFAFSLMWDETWKVTNSKSESGQASLELDNGSSLLYVNAYLTADDLQACLDRRTDELKASEAIANVKTATGRAGALSGGDQSQAWIVLDFTYLVEGKSTELRLMLQCFTLTPGQSQLVFADFIPSGEYLPELAEYQALLATLSIGPSNATPVAAV